MEIAEKFLPIGTVVLLKGGKKELMIMGYCILSDGEAYDKKGVVDVAGKMFDYGGCVYPEGQVASDQIFAFNHDQIEKVSFMGYETDAQKELSETLNAARKEFDKIVEAAALAKEEEKTEEETAE